MKYIEFIAFPLMTLVVYFFMGFIQWDRDPGNWSWNARCLWIIWAMVWGVILQIRLKLDRLKQEGEI